MTALARLPGTGGIAAAWVAAAGILGFAVSGVFASLLHLGRGPFVLAHALVVGILVTRYCQHSGNDPLADSRRRRGGGVLVGVVLGGILVYGVIGQPGGAAPEGIELAASLGWYGLVYGTADALLLTVVPVAAVRGLLGVGFSGRLAHGAVALAASLLVTALYHLGFEEFRSPSLAQPLIGNAIVTLGYLVTGNPLTPLLAHSIMHGAAVVHGMEATVQLPPHY